MIEDKLGNRRGTLPNEIFELYQVYLQILHLADRGTRIDALNLKSISSIREKFDNLGRGDRAAFYEYLISKGSKGLADFFKRKYNNWLSLDESPKTEGFTPEKRKELRYAILSLCNADRKSLTSYELEVYIEHLNRLKWGAMKELYREFVNEDKTVAIYLLNNFIREKFLVHSKGRGASIENVV